MQHYKNQNVIDNIFTPEKELRLFTYSLTPYHSISLYSTTNKTIVRATNGMMGDGLIGIEYCCINGSCSINAPQDLIKLMCDKFIEIIEAKFIENKNPYYRLNTDVNFLYQLAKEVNSVFECWLGKNQAVDC